MSPNSDYSEIKISLPKVMPPENSVKQQDHFMQHEETYLGYFNAPYGRKNV